MSDSKGFLYTLFLKKWHPVPTVMSTVLLFGLFGLAFIIFGIVVTVINGSIQEVTIEKYDNNPNCNGVSHHIYIKQKAYNQACTFTFDLKQPMSPPIYFYYELENFYQNHRRYVKSKSSSQLIGETVALSEAQKYCDPIIRNKDLFTQQQTHYIDKNSVMTARTVPLDPEGVANPCGLIAKSLFNDTYAMTDPNSDSVSISQTGISWPNDQGKKFKANAKSTTIQWIDPENEHFIVWMRTAGLSTFRKLWGRIEQPLIKGNYTFSVMNNYNPSTFAGAKNIVLSTSGPFGGKNYFLSIAFIVVGVICILIAAAFFIKKKISKDAFGEKKEI